MNVAELIRRLEAVEDKSTYVEFHDVTYGRDCPVNSILKTKKNANGHPVLVLSNRLGG